MREGGGGETCNFKDFLHEMVVETRVVFISALPFFAAVQYNFSLLHVHSQRSFKCT